MASNSNRSDSRQQTRIHCVRHGRVSRKWHGKVYGQLDVGLSDAGQLEAQRAATSLDSIELASVVSSGLERAEFGAACIRKSRTLPRRDEAALAEIHRGEWAGLLPSEIEVRWPGGWQNWWRRPGELKPPGGESLTDLATRVLPCVSALADEYFGEEIAIVAHSWVIRVCVTHALGLAPEAATRLDLPPASIAVLDWPKNEASGGTERPTLAGFCSDRAVVRRTAWFRGPRR